MDVPPTDKIQAALALLHLWKAVRPDILLHGISGHTLEVLEYALRVPTVLGEVLILSVQGRRMIGLTGPSISDTVAVNAIYRQDAQPYLQDAGYHTLRPGKGIYSVVEDAQRTPCPLLGRVTGTGYSARHIRHSLEALRVNLVLARAKLVVVVPVNVVWEDRHLEIIYAPPRWAPELAIPNLG